MKFGHLEDAQKQGKDVLEREESASREKPAARTEIWAAVWQDRSVCCIAASVRL
jgi:hypothetical protein